MPTENRSSNTDQTDSSSKVTPEGMVKSINALLDLDARNVLAPHGIGGLARDILTKCAEVLSRPADHHQGEPVALPERMPTGNNTEPFHPWSPGVREGWNKCLDEITKMGSLYTHADAGEVERLVSANTEYARRHLEQQAEVERLLGLVKSYEEIAESHADACAEALTRLTQRDALLREQSGKLIVLAARLLQEPLRVLNGDLESDGPITRIKVTDGVERAGDSLGGLAVEVRRAADALSASAGPSTPAALIPDGYCLMPKQLTAENGAKALLLGEFKLRVTRECPECLELEEPLEGCEICDGEGEYEQRHTIPWDQIKFIYSEAVKGLALNPGAALERKS